MNRLLPILAVSLISIGATATLPLTLPGTQVAGVVAPPSKPRQWRIEMPQWQPVQSGRFERLGRYQRYVARQNDRWAIRANIKIPGDAGPLVVSLIVKLGKDQKTPDDDAYWPSIIDALGAIGIDARPGKTTFDEVRGGSRDDVGTTVVLEEIQ